MRKVYLDHNATTPVHPDVLAAMLPALQENFGNPSSVHWAGTEAKPLVDKARKIVARLISAQEQEIVFTAGGSEGDNMAIKGVMMKTQKGAHMVTSTIEHPAVYDTCIALEAMGFKCTYVEADEYGIVSAEDVRKAMRPETVLVSIMLANNETGAINPIREIADTVRRDGALMHTDAVQGVGKIPVNVSDLGVDMLTASGHKFNAPKGVGFQYMRDGVEALPLILGGSQEWGHRASTENVPGIVGIGAACEVAIRDMRARLDDIGAMRDRLESGILKSVPGALVNGPVDKNKRMYNTLSISFPGIEGEALMMLLNQAGIAVSTGSACHSDSSKPSRVLGAMGMDAIRARGTLRLSLGHGVSKEDIDYVLETLPPMASGLLQMSTLSK